MAFKSKRLSGSDLGRVVEMAWEDRTPFEAIESNYGLSESDVITLMRQEMKPSSFRLWRKRCNRSKDQASSPPRVYFWSSRLPDSTNSLDHKVIIN